MAEEPTEQVEPESEVEEAQKPRRSAMVWVWAALLIALVILIIFLLLWTRSCTPSRAVRGTTPSPSPTTPVSDSSIPNRIHAAIHPLAMPGGGQLDDAVYVIDVAQGDSGIIASIRLVSLSDWHLRKYGNISASSIARSMEDVTLAQVAEVQTIRVLDSNGNVVSSEHR